MLGFERYRERESSLLEREAMEEEADIFRELL